MAQSLAAEQFKEWQVSSFGNDVLIVRDPEETKEAGKNIKAFYMKNAEGKFQLAAKEAFREYHKMLKDKGEKMPEEKPVRKEAHLNEEVYSIELDGSSVSIDFMNHRELNTDESISRDLGHGLDANITPVPAMTSIRHLTDQVDRMQGIMNEFKEAAKTAGMRHMGETIRASQEKEALEKNDRLEATSFGSSVIVLRDPKKPKEGGQNLEAFYMKNEEGKFQLATKEAFHEYRKMLKDKGEKLPEERLLSKSSLEKDLKGKVFEIRDNEGNAVTLDFESRRELSFEERLVREAGFAPEKAVEPMTSIRHLSENVDRTQSMMNEFREAVKTAGMRHMGETIRASQEKEALEKNDRLEATSFGSSVIVLRDPKKPKEGGQNLEAFYMKNEEGKFQLATKEAFHEYRKMLKDKGEKLPEERLLSKSSLEKDLKGKVFEIRDNEGNAVTLDFESRRELSFEERLVREAGFAPEKAVEPMTSIRHLSENVDRTQSAMNEFKEASKKAEMRHMGETIRASQEKAALEKNDRLEATSFGSSVIVLRDPKKPKEGGQNLEAFYMKNEEGKFQLATKEAFHAYHKMLKDKGEKLPEERPLRKAPTKGEAAGHVFEISDKDGKTVSLDLTNKRELNTDERLSRDLGHGLDANITPVPAMTSIQHLADQVDRMQSMMKGLQPAGKSTLMQQLSAQEAQAKPTLMQQLSAQEAQAKGQPHSHEPLSASSPMNKQILDRFQKDRR